jgi:hypothetical protein
MYIRRWSGNQNERDHLEGLRANGRIILKWILTHYVESATWTFTSVRIKNRTVCCDYGNKNSSSINCGEFLNYLDLSE